MHWSPSVNEFEYRMTCVKAHIKRFRLPTILLYALCPLSGCFFDRVRQSEENDIQRVEQKQTALQTEQSRAAALPQRENQLASELSERQLSLQELSGRVQEINGANGRDISDNDAARRRYDVLIGQLHETNDRLAVAQRSNEGSTDERRERIATLKAQLKKQLDALLR